MLYNPDWKPAETEVETWRTTLRKAADLIEQNGWCIGKPVDQYGAMCFLGALAVAEGIPVILGMNDPEQRHRVYEDRESVEKLADFIRMSYPIGTVFPQAPHEIVYGYNDNMVMSKDAAVHVLREAADYKGI